METAYLVDGRRTPFGRFRGALAGERPDDLLADLIRDFTALHPDIPWDLTDEIVIGCANQAGEDNRNIARMAGLLSGLPVHVPALTVNRLCASGLDAIVLGARAIQCGDADLVLAGGVENMTRAPYVLPKQAEPWSRSIEAVDTTIGWRLVNPRMRDTHGTHSLVETAQILADEMNIGRDEQDSFALRSQQRAQAAIAAGTFDREILPVQTKNGSVARDEHPRVTDRDRLATLAPLIPDGSVTAGNSSGINDGAAITLIASQRAVDRYHLKPLARIAASGSIGVPPRVMGVGPVGAVDKVLSKTGLKLADIDLIEINEAFAAQTLAVTRSLGLPDDADHVNPGGGAIALGHPLGASGTRVALTAAQRLDKERLQRALVTVCVGVGQGVALLLERA